MDEHGDPLKQYHHRRLSRESGMGLLGLFSEFTVYVRIPSSAGSHPNTAEPVAPY